MPEKRSSDSGCGWGRLRRQPWTELDDYDRASPAVDCVLLTVDQGQLAVLVQRRSHEPHAGEWALPGVFVNFGARYEDEILRALKEKAGVGIDCHVEQLVSWNAPDRDPRGWVITVAHLALAPAVLLRRELSEDITTCLAPVTVPWSGEAGGDVELTVGSKDKTALAFDHNMLVGLAIARLRGKLRYTPLALELMEPEFTLREFQSVYEAVLGRPLNRATFRKNVLETGHLVESTGRLEPPTVGHRPAELYRRAGTLGE